MFSKSSRYYSQKVVDTVTKEGRTVKAVTLRRLPSVTGESTVVKGNDRLDIMAGRRYDNGAMFWHVADANTRLQANDLVKEPGRTIKVPES
ncbi:MAG: hypothetical protein GY737_17965 [Desulfobacteraceae bacterium]|nr:hypothetical protein [Desulfobacteraceae bacterium]